MLVSAPGSSANLGPGFDCLGLAVDLPFWFEVRHTDRPERSVGATAPEAPTEMLVAEPTHPAAVAFVEAGGDPGARLRWRSPIPPGRGLGFSGAARVAGAFAARRTGGDDVRAARAAAFDVAEQLEGHGDNAAASTYGGCVLAVDGTVVPLVFPPGLAVVAWSPSAETSTDASRAALQPRVTLEDAAFSAARAALWVAALSQDRADLLAEASRDRLHQPARLAKRPDSAAVLEVFRATEGVHAAWLSGSGPTVAALVDSHSVEAVSRVRPGVEPAGRMRVMAVDTEGVKEI